MGILLCPRLETDEPQTIICCAVTRSCATAYPSPGAHKEQRASPHCTRCHPRTPQSCGSGKTASWHPCRRFWEGCSKCIWRITTLNWRHKIRRVLHPQDAFIWHFTPPLGILSYSLRALCADRAFPVLLWIFSVLPPAKFQWTGNLLPRDNSCLWKWCLSNISQGESGCYHLVAAKYPL